MAANDIEAVRRAAARAATDPALWPEALWRLGQLVGSEMTVVDHFDKASGRVTIGFNDRPDVIAATREAYEGHYAAVNPRWRLASWLPMDAISTDDLIGDDAALGRDEYYVDFLAPSGLKYFIASPLLDDADQTVVLTMQRGPGRGRVGEAEIADFAAALPALRRAMAVQARLGGARLNGALSALFDRLTEPIALVGDGGRLLIANPVMERLLETGQILCAVRGGIEGATAGVARALARLWRDAAAGDGLAAVAIAGADGPLILRLAPLDPGLGAGPADATHCLIVDDPARPDWPLVDAAMRLFGLTRREATVGAQLAAGLTVDTIAARLGVSRNTVRSHLAMLRDKLGARSALGVAAIIRRAVSPFA